MEPIKSLDLDLKLNAIDIKEGSSVLHVSVVPPLTGTRKPCDCICILDISGSMGTSASIETGGEIHGFSRLDLVKHSVSTIIHMLTPTDRLAIIPFSTVAEVALDMTVMNEVGKATAMKMLDSLEPTNSTNVWAGLKVAIDLARKHGLTGSGNANILLFTDGESNDNPPDGVVNTLRNYVKGGDQPFTIQTFGYGYSLDSDLLLSISNLGNGIFNFIPDSTMVGTIFVNYVSNSLAAVAKNTYIDFALEGVGAIKCLGYDMTGSTLATGEIQYGQMRDFIFEFNVKPGESFKISATLRYDAKTLTKVIDKKSTEIDMELFKEYSRCKYIDAMSKKIDPAVKYTEDTSFLTAIVEEIKKLPSKEEPQMKALIRDIFSPKESEGQALKAFSKGEWYAKWGAHYIRSLVRAHQLQQCHNFKDPGVQNYGGKVFKDLQNDTDKIFCSLPPPKPSIREADKPIYQPANMQGYMDYNAGCFDGEGLVKLSNGTSKKVKDLKKGDELCSLNGANAKVACLVVFPIHQKIDVVNLNGVLVTPWHPVLEHGVWVFPKNIKATEQVYCENIYNLVLNTGHVVIINGVELVTLGHGLHDNSVIEHAYFGTEKVIEDLRKVSGWSEGNILFDRCVTTRDPSTGLVSGLH